MLELSSSRFSTALPQVMERAGRSENNSTIGVFLLELSVSVCEKCLQQVSASN